MILSRPVGKFSKGLGFESLLIPRFTWKRLCHVSKKKATLKQDVYFDESNDVIWTTNQKRKEIYSKTLQIEKEFHATIFSP